MARLSPDQLNEILKRTSRTTELTSCIIHHDRLRLHVEEVNSVSQASSAITEFLDRAEHILTPKKYERFRQLLRFPLESNKLTRKIFADLRRVFDGKNRVIRYQFISGAAEADFDAYRKDELKDEEFFEEDVFEHIRTNINDFIVVDMPTSIRGQRPAPQPYIVRAEQIIDVKVNRDNICEYIVYDIDSRTRVIIDAAAYRVYRKGQDERWVLDVNNEHGLGETPAKSIWSDYMHPSKNYLEKTGPISASVSDMDEVNFWDIGRRYYEMYGSFPLYWEYKIECKYQDEEGNICENGYINYEEWPGEYDPSSGDKLTNQPIKRQKPCPSCQKNENLFAGTTFYVDAPKSKEDADMREPMGFVNVDSAALKYNDERQERRKVEVINFCVGINTEPMREQAINEKQVSSFFEDRKAVLFRVKRNFEIIHQWTLQIIAKLRYGTQFKKVYVNYGDEFYLRSEAELVQSYGEARKAGLPSYLLEGNRRLLAETRFRTDYQALQRGKVLEDLEPYPDYTVQELMLMKNQLPEIVNSLKLTVKISFSDFIAKFERQESDILIFGENLPYKEKIDRINQKLEEYANEEIRSSRQYADQEHSRKLQQLEAEARANGAANQSGGGGERPGSSKKPGGGKSSGRAGKA